MNTLGIDFDADKQEQQRDWSQDITFGGTVYGAIVSLPTEGRAFEGDGSGNYVTRNIMVEISRLAIGDTVSVGAIITYQGDEYRIVDLGNPDETGWYFLTCEGKAL